MSPSSRTSDPDAPELPEAPEALGATGATGAARPARSTGRGISRRGSATTAAVNLLSPWVVDELRVRRLRLRFLSGAVVLLLLIAAGWAWLRLDLMRTEAALRADQDATGVLTGQLDDLAPVRSYGAAVARRTLEIEGVMGRQVNGANVLNTLELMLPPETTLSSLTVTLPVDAGSTGSTGSTDPAAAGDPLAPVCPGPDPFATRPVVGCIQLTGTAPDRQALSVFVQRLGRRVLFVEPFVDTTTVGGVTEGADGTGGETVAFTGTVGLAPESWSLRYVDLADVDRPTSPTTEPATEPATEDES